MAFGDGRHRKCRSGGDNQRKPGEIFINAFQGKIADLVDLIQEKHILPKGAKVGKSIMDAENYYIQANDMRLGNYMINVLKQIVD